MEHDAKRIYTCNMHMINENLTVLQSDTYGILKTSFGTRPDEMPTKSTIVASRYNGLYGVTLVDIFMTKAGIEYLNKNVPFYGSQS